MAIRPKYPKNPGLAALLGLIIPGAGQFYNEQYMKGVGILGGVTLLTAGIVATAFRMAGVMGLSRFNFHVRYHPSVDLESVVLIAVLGIGILALWLIGVFDALFTAQRISEADREETEGVTDDERESEDRRGRPDSNVLIGLILVVLGAVFFLSKVSPGWIRGLFSAWPLLVVGLGILLVIRSSDQRDGDKATVADGGRLEETEPKSSLGSSEEDREQQRTESEESSRQQASTEGGVEETTPSDVESSQPLDESTDDEDER